jgi:selenocysteine lyase/cysteine desulfurase
MLYVKSERIPDIWPNVVAPGWGNQVEPEVRGARKFESLGQRDDAALAAISDAVDFHQTLGFARVEQRVHDLANMLKTGLIAAGLKLLTPLDGQLSAGVCIVDVPARARTEVAARMYAEYGIAGAATGGFRLCPHIYNTKDHIARAIRGLSDLRRLIG